MTLPPLSRQYKVFPLHIKILAVMKETKVVYMSLEFTIIKTKLLGWTTTFKAQSSKRKGNHTIADLRYGENTVSVLAHSFLLP